MEKGGGKDDRPLPIVPNSSYAKPAPSYSYINFIRAWMAPLFELIRLLPTPIVNFYFYFTVRFAGRADGANNALPPSSPAAIPNNSSTDATPDGALPSVNGDILEQFQEHGVETDNPNCDGQSQSLDSMVDSVRLPSSPEADEPQNPASSSSSEEGSSGTPEMGNFNQNFNNRGPVHAVQAKKVKNMHIGNVNNFKHGPN